MVEPVPAVKEKREEVVEKEDEYEDFFEEDKSDEVNKELHLFTVSPKPIYISHWDERYLLVGPLK